MNPTLLMDIGQFHPSSGSSQSITIFIIIIIQFNYCALCLDYINITLKKKKCIYAYKYIIRIIRIQLN